jgi:ABC-type glycerol-3-phosphate transport system permease component
MWTWNDFLWPLILLRDPNWFTIQLGVQRFQEQFTVNYALQNAGIAFAVLPPLIFYLIFREGIQKGLTSGAIKL